MSGLLPRWVVSVRSPFRIHDVVIDCTVWSPALPFHSAMYCHSISSVVITELAGTAECDTS